MNWVAEFVDPRAIRRFGIGDVLAISLFLVVGEIHHGIDPMQDPLYVGDTIAPFLIGWVIASPVLGAYARLAVERRFLAPVLVVPAWIGADLIGQVLRGSRFFHGGSGPTFALVVGVMGVISLVVWRVVFVLWRD